MTPSDQEKQDTLVEMISELLTAAHEHLKLESHDYQQPHGDPLKTACSSVAQRLRDDDLLPQELEDKW